MQYLSKLGSGVTGAWGRMPTPLKLAVYAVAAAFVYRTIRGRPVNIRLGP